MNSPSPFANVPESLIPALEEKGFTGLTAVQQAVLAPSSASRDLRICSETGSGKTVAIGLALARDLALTESTTSEPGEGAEEARAPKGKNGAPPRALIVAPTRELATQLAKELTWLLAPTGARICVLTGGTGVSLEARALAQRPAVIVGTPGRLVDHLERKTLVLDALQTVVLDEADQMLDLGFREALETILAHAPEGRRTHLVSATFSRAVLGLANRIQKDPIQVFGSRQGAANPDIEHIAYVVKGDERNLVLRNVLLLAPDELTLIFVRTRVDTADTAAGLSRLGFSAGALSGELEQRERTRILDAFRSGSTRILVATDVAARGLDIPEVSRVIHADPPGDAEALTHRSGRTGRAGRKGSSIMLVPEHMRESISRAYARAKIPVKWQPAPTPPDVLAAADERLREGLMAEVGEAEGDPRFFALADEVLQERPARDVVAELLRRSRHSGPCEPVSVTPVHTRERPGYAAQGQERGRLGAPNARNERWVRREEPRPTSDELRCDSFERTTRRPPSPQAAALQAHTTVAPKAVRPPTPPPSSDVPAKAVFAPSKPAEVPAPRVENPAPRAERPAPRAERPAPRAERPALVSYPSATLPAVPRAVVPSEANAAKGVIKRAPLAAGSTASFVPFRVNWGERSGANASRLLALVCRRGQVDSKHIGSIRVGENSSFFEVLASSARLFARSAKEPDPRDPKIRIDAVQEHAPKFAPTSQAFRKSKPAKPTRSAGTR